MTRLSAEFVQDAGAQLLELVRGEHGSSFSVTIVCANDKWIISTTEGLITARMTFQIPPSGRSGRAHTVGTKTAPASG
jgi:hypothetical protein